MSQETENTFEKIRAVVARELDIELSEIHPESSFVSLGAESLELAALMLELEDELGIEIPDDDISKLPRVMDVVAYVDSRSAAL
jgi:acyl carrier protein